MLWFPPASASLFRHQKRTILVGLVSESIECVLACLCAPTFPLWHLFYVVSYCYVTKLRVLTSPALALGTTRSVRRNRALVRPWHCRYAMYPPYCTVHVRRVDHKFLISNVVRVPIQVAQFAPLGKGADNYGPPP